MRHRIIAALSLLLVCACKLTKEQELEDVAKDWALTIRASQVMPVYPLTEDLQPGDVFLVQLPIDQQQRTWKQKGYLPLDNHLARLDPTGYPAFYDHSLLMGAKPDVDPLLPWLWQSSKPGTNAGDPKVAAWEHAARAGFPTYSFSVRSSGGLNLAIPISGVPVGLGVMGSDAADGTVSIKKARTLGVDQASLYAQVRTWAAEHREYLAPFASRGPHKNYLRIVSRIYLTGEVDVSLRDASSRNAGADVGAPKPLATQMVAVPADALSTPQEAVKNYEEALKALNDTIEPVTTTLADGTKAILPGGSVRFTSVSARTVSMSETFDPPLVIGYLGFDVEIGELGEIGPPVPTFAVLDYGIVPASSATSQAQYISNSRMLTVVRALREMAKADDARAKELLVGLEQLGSVVPPQWPCPIYDDDGNVFHATGSALRTNPPQYETLSEYRGGLLSSIESLESRLKTGEFKLEDTGDADPKTFLEGRLAMARQELAWLNERLRPHIRLLAEADRHTAPYQAH